jgi:hypothetical protein
MSAKNDRELFDAEFNPYAAPDVHIAPGAGMVLPGSAASKGSLEVTHDLTTAELKRWFEFDTFYDPKPFLGFVPQWLLLAIITGCAVFVVVWGKTRLVTAACIVGPIAGIASIWAREVRMATNRSLARQEGLCENRTIRINPQGVVVAIPGRVASHLPCIGPAAYYWRDFRKIEVADCDIVFWIAGRKRLRVPCRAFPTSFDAVEFLNAALYWRTKR